jgi:AcrR family transcriptional regulator
MWSGAPNITGALLRLQGSCVPDLRADAKRNRSELLDVARQVIAEQGADASLRDIARRAGVGIGTLYRHFPTREDLLAAIISGGVTRMAARARDLAVTIPPADALATWLGELAVRIGPYKGLPAESVIHGDSALRTACEDMMDAGRDLLTAAQSANTVRPDVVWEDVFRAVVAISGIAVQSGPESARRVLAIYLDGLRAFQARP